MTYWQLLVFAIVGLWCVCAYHNLLYLNREVRMRGLAALNPVNYDSLTMYFGCILAYFVLAPLAFVILVKETL